MFIFYYLRLKLGFHFNVSTVEWILINFRLTWGLLTSRPDVRTLSFFFFIFIFLNFFNGYVVPQIWCLQRFSVILNAPEPFPCFTAS